MTLERNFSTTESQNTHLVDAQDGKETDQPLQEASSDSIETSAHQEPTIDARYDVRDLQCPYRGLKPYTYAQREIYTGRTQDVQAGVETLTQKGHEQTLLFVTGAVGSGKSSFAQAGLLPALVAHYTKNSVQIHHAVLRPSSQPINALTHALSQLDIPTSLSLDAVVANPKKLSLFISQTTRTDHVNLLVIDQFEELFTLSEHAQKEAFFHFLETLPDFATLRTHIIITFSSHFLPHLFERKKLFDISRSSIDLRALSEQEITQAIQHPLQHTYAEQGKQWDSKVIQHLAQEGVQDDSQLPFLQANLVYLWKQGSLNQLPEYPLAHAVEHWAEQIYRCCDAHCTETRPETERHMILDILQKLITLVPSPDSSTSASIVVRQRRSVTEVLNDVVPSLNTEDTSRRNRRKKKETREQQQQKDTYLRLIEELCQAGLLVKTLHSTPNTSVETIEIVHDTVLHNWSRLQKSLTDHQQQQEIIVQTQQHLEQSLSKGTSNDVKSIPTEQTNRQQEPTVVSEQSNPSDAASLATYATDPNATVDTSQAVEQLLQRKAFRRRLYAQYQRFIRLGMLVLIIFVLGVGVFWIFNGKSPMKMLESQHHQAPMSLTDEDKEQTAMGFNQQSTSEIEQAIAEQTATVLQKTTESIQQEAALQATSLRIKELLLEAETKLNTNPELALLLTLEVAKVEQNAEIETILRQAIQKLHLRLNLRGHRDIVWSATYSPDGQHILTASDDMTASVWNAVTGEELLVLRGHEAGIWGARYSPDGKRIVTASEDETARVWDATSGEELVVLRDEEGRFNSVAFSPDGSSILTASDTDAAYLWDANSGEQIRTFQGGGGANSASFSPNGERIATANFDNRIRIWNAENGSLFLSIYGHSDVIWNAVYSPNGERIASASADNTVRIWNAENGVELLSIEDIEARRVQFSPDGKHIVTAGWDGTARVWDAENGDELFVLQGHTAVINSVQFSPNGQRIVTASSDKKVRVWDAGLGAEALVLRAEGDPIRSIAFHPDGQWIATASSDNIARIWDVASGLLLQKIEGHDDEVTDVAFSPDGERLATASADTTVQIWGIDNGLQQHLLDRHEDIVWSVAFSPDGNKLASASQDQTARVWEVSSGREILVLRGHEGGVHSVAFSPDGRTIATASGDKTVRLWNADTGKEQNVLRGHDQSVNSVAYSRDSRYIVSTSGDKTAYVWDAETGDVLVILRGHERSLHNAHFQPDGTRIATASSDMTARLWNTTTGEELMALTGHSDRVNQVIFSPNGEYIVTASQDGTARFYYSSFDAVLDLAKRCVTRSLTDEEREQYSLSSF